MKKSLLLYPQFLDLKKLEIGSIYKNALIKGLNTSSLKKQDTESIIHHNKD